MTDETPSLNGLQTLTRGAYMQYRNLEKYLRKRQKCRIKNKIKNVDLLQTNTILTHDEVQRFDWNVPDEYFESRFQINQAIEVHLILWKHVEVKLSTDCNSDSLNKSKQKQNYSELMKWLKMPSCNGKENYNLRKSRRLWKAVTSMDSIELRATSKWINLLL